MAVPTAEILRDQTTPAAAPTESWFTRFARGLVVGLAPAVGVQAMPAQTGLPAPARPVTVAAAAPTNWTPLLVAGGVALGLGALLMIGTAPRGRRR